jgi:hypothetical protein
MALTLTGRFKAKNIGIKIVTGVGGGGGGGDPTPSYGYTVLNTLDAASIVTAKLYQGGTTNYEGTYFESLPEHHMVNWTSRKIYTPVIQSDDGGDTFRVVFFEYTMSSGMIRYLDPFREGSVETPPMAYMTFQMAHIDPYKGDLWFVVHDGDNDAMRVFVARADSDFKVMQSPYDGANMYEGEWRIIGFKSDAALFAYTTFDGTPWNANFSDGGTHLIAFQTDWSAYGQFNNVLKPSGRKKIIQRQQVFAQAFAANGDLYLLIDGRGWGDYASKVRLLKYTIPTLTNVLPTFDGSGIPPVLTGTVSDITPWTSASSNAATDFEYGLGATTASLILPRLYINRTTNNLLVLVSQVKPNVPKVGQAGSTTHDYCLTNIGRYTISGGTFTLLPRHDGMWTAAGAQTTTAGSAKYVVDETVTTDTYLVRSDKAFTTMPDSTWIWTHRTDLIEGAVRVMQETAAEDSPRYYVLEHRSLDDWSLIESVDVAATLDPVVPEYPAASADWIHMVDYDTLYPGQYDPLQFPIEYDPTTQSFIIRYDEGSASLSGLDGNINDQNARLVKVTLA